MRKFIQRKPDEINSDPLSANQRSIIFKKNPSEGDGSTIDDIQENEEILQKSSKQNYDSHTTKKSENKEMQSDASSTHSSTIQKLKKSIELAKSARQGMICRVAEKSKKVEAAKRELTEKQLAIQNILKEYQNSSTTQNVSGMLRETSIPLSLIKEQVGLMNLNHTNIEDRITFESLDSSEKAIRKISNQFDNVLGFVTDSQYEYKQCDVLELLKSAAIKIDIPYGVSLKLSPNSCLVSCDPSKMSSVFQNILTNAVQAVGYSGYIHVQVLEDAKNCIIQIEDSGQGVSEEHIDKIFEPLFTTKVDGNGLGLARCKEIVTNHKGTISFENNPTKFTITLPKQDI